MLKRIYWYGAGSNHNIETSVYGGKLIKLPLMEALMGLNFEIDWIGFDCDDYRTSHFIDLLNIKQEDFVLDVTSKIENSNFMNFEKTHIDERNIRTILDYNPGALLIEMRPNFDKPGYNFQNEWTIQLELINIFYDMSLPVFLWDQDIWCDQIPKDMRHKVVLLKPYFAEADKSFIYQEEFLYMWHKPWFDDKLDKIAKNKIFDVVYCGNVYNRKDEFLEFFKLFHDENKKVVIQGNWLRKKYGDRDFSLDNFPDFMFFGSTPHWTTLPTIAMAKSVIHFANADQQIAGLATARIFEALMGKSVIFCSNAIKDIRKIVPDELVVADGHDLVDRWNIINKEKQWLAMRHKFEMKLMIEEFSADHRAKEFASFIKEYS